MARLKRTEEHMPSEARLRDLLVGKSIVEARISNVSPDPYWDERGPVGYLTLSDGTRLKVWGNDGGCACTAGCYPLARLSSTENIITNVFVEENRTGEDTERENWDDGGYFRIFVIAGDERINIASFEGDDGNGWYGTGWYLKVMEEPR